ncbi:GntR family transcriptional regulator [Roseitranquillus sediminis]|uniref:GntR family transcriptional regulator n=1 Tax=Roseitranquillus sediminis TaxID=2809051 RepID=UPI001D0C713F|nr:GntR family transcriptional regulator [Roseitranquillus sediminis]MBM9593173.1 GntR family transcriptional regulator [Roseitranquillus sediminis]
MEQDSNFDLAIERPSLLLRDQVVARLRRAIVTGRYRPGQRLLERELCDAVGVSRTSVREALRQLEIEKLVAVGPRGRPSVALITSAQAREIYEFREVLEAAAIPLFVARAPEAAFRQLEALTDRFAKAVESGDVDERLQVKVEFYEVLFGAACNPSMQTVFIQLFNRIGFLRSRSLRQQDRAQMRSDEMREIVARLVVRDVSGAQAAIVRHVRSVGELAVRHLEELETTRG